MNAEELSILKYYKEGNEMCGFEPNSPWRSLVNKDYLDGDLELTSKGSEFIKTYRDWDNVIAYNNRTVVQIKPSL